MVDHDLLHRELAEFASALTDDFDLHESLQGLTHTAATALSLSGAGVTLSLPSGGTQYIAGSDPATRHVERRQDELKQGACMAAIQTSQVVMIPDIAAEPRWPEYREA